VDVRLKSTAAIWLPRGEALVTQFPPPSCSTRTLDLVGAVAPLLYSGRLVVPEARTLGHEVREFRAKVTAAGNEVMAADWRAGVCKDPVPALAMAACLGEHAVMGFRVRW
jgi:hypothetical protein